MNNHVFTIIHHNSKYPNIAAWAISDPYPFIFPSAKHITRSLRFCRCSLYFYCPLLAGIKSTSTIILTIVVCIIFVLMSAVFISQTLARKQEFALLKANDMQEHNLVRMMIVESLWQSMHILLTALCVLALQ